VTTTLAPPPPPAPPSLTPGGRTAIRVALVAVAALLIVGVVVALSALAWGLTSVRVITDTATLPTTLRSVAVDAGPMPGQIRIVSDPQAREPRVDLRMVNSTRAASEPLVVDTDGTSARVSINTDSSRFLDRGRAGQLTLVLPQDLAGRLTVTAQQEIGVVTAEADVDQFIARTGEGAVLLSGSARHIDITATEGDVVATEPISVSESFRVSTNNGDVDINFAEVPETVDASTRRGNVDLRLPQPGPFVVNATSGRQGGSTVVEVPQTRDTGEAVAVVDAHSDNGDVTVDRLN